MARSTTVTLADELPDTSAMSDDLFAELGKMFDTREILELTVTAGWYDAIAYVIGVAGLDPEAWADRFPNPESVPTRS
ncbi:carboxymuconolactone decarboxylase family protein [Mycolicibacterium palauense]|uniref:hypothetical protein n=1 Tax=Mycolicibacterium palauense TaxID=2034511 RepID=UPI000BFEC086|nr:hypothetical protein [Mycolicibacterium palauense]